MFRECVCDSWILQIMECKMKNQEKNMNIIKNQQLIMSNWCLKNAFINENFFWDINIFVLGIFWCQPPRLHPFPHLKPSYHYSVIIEIMCDVKLTLKKLMRFLVSIFWGSWVSEWEAKWSQFLQLLATEANIPYKTAFTQPYNQKLSRFLIAGLSSRQDPACWHDILFHQSMAICVKILILICYCSGKWREWVNENVN